MFHADRWAAAFTGALDNKAEAGLACLKELAQRLEPVSSALFGYSAARLIEETLCETAAARAGGQAGKEGGAETEYEYEYAVRFICLLVEKKLFRKIDLVIAKIEKTLDDKNGVLEVMVETAAACDSAFFDELGGLIRGRTGAARVKTRERVVPELLAGYRLRLDGLCVDASLKGQLEQMAADLTAGGQAAAEN